MLVMIRTLRIVAATICMIGLAACQNEDRPGPQRSTVLEFSERVTVGIDLPGSSAPATDGAIASLLIDNNGTEPLRVVRIQPIADEELKVQYLGYCSRSCQGTGRWSKETQAEVTSGIEGIYPVEILPAQMVQAKRRLVFRLYVAGVEGREVLGTKCMVFRSTKLTLDNGSQISVTAFGNRPIAGVFARLQAASACDEEFGDGAP